MDENNKSWKTAIVRKSPSLPASWVDIQYCLFDKGPIKKMIERGTKVLDYGCGRGYDASWLGADKFDPHWFPDEVLENEYDITLCTYVLNVVERQEQGEILDFLDDIRAPEGTTYVTVRRDLKFFDDPQRDGYVQRYVLDGDMKIAGYRSVKLEKGAFEIYAKGPVPSLENL